MGAIADRPEEDNNYDDNNNTSYIDSFEKRHEVELPLEKQLTHLMFCQQIKTISYEDALKLLAQLHMLYLGQTVLFTKMAKQEFFR